MTASPASNETRLPRAVQRISDNVKARLAEHETQRLAAQTELEPPSPASTASVDPPPLETHPAPAATDTPPASGSNWRGSTPPQDDPRYNDPAYWRQRFSVTEGRISAIERERKSEREASQTQVAALQEEVRTLKASAPSAPVDITALFTPQEIETYGEDQCRIVASKSTQIAKDIVSRELETRMKPIEDARVDDAKRDKERRKREFEDQVTALYPRWVEIDQDPRWWAWLDSDDPATGVSRRTILGAHIERGSARGAAGMFKAYDDGSRVPIPPVIPHGQGATGDAPALAAPSPIEVQGLRHPTVAEKRDFFKRDALGKVTKEEHAQFDARLRLPNPNAIQVRSGAG